MSIGDKLETAFWSQLYSLSIPLVILVGLKILQFLFQRLMMVPWVKKLITPIPVTPEDPSQPNLTKNNAKGSEDIKKPKLSQGPYIDTPSEHEPYLPGNINLALKVKKLDCANRGRSSSKNNWLEGYFTFSFGLYKNKDYEGHGGCRVFNEEIISPGKGYPQLIRKDFEILTLVIDGRLRHIDSLENDVSLPSQSVQILTCGVEGVNHIEENDSNLNELHYLQLWFAPNLDGLRPDYQKLEFSSKVKRNKLIPIVSPFKGVDQIEVEQVTAEAKSSYKGSATLGNKPKKDDKTLPKPSIDLSTIEKVTLLKNTIGLHSDTYFYYCMLEPNNKVSLQIGDGPKRKGMVHLITNQSDAQLQVNQDTKLNSGDSAFLSNLESSYSVEAENIGKEACTFVFLEMA